MTIHKLDVDSIKKDLDFCHEQIKAGGDWEKWNKLKVYEGLYSIMIWDYKKTSDLFLDSVATFSCGDLIDFK